MTRKLTLVLFLAALAAAPFTGVISAEDEAPVEPGLVAEGLIFEQSAELPSSHGSSIAQMPDGSILCAWYSGTAEANKDVAIWASRWDGKSWTRPVVIADTPDKPEGNPVLFVDATGKTWLFFVTIHGFGWNWAKIKYQTSDDSGRTWSPVTILRNKRGWMTRNHPIILKDGRILLPLYSENKWCSEFMDSGDGGKTWNHISEVCSKPGNIQSSVVELDDGSLYSTMRTGAGKGQGGRVWETRSTDGGHTWTPAAKTSLFNPNAGTDMIRLASGKLLIAYNNSDSKRSPLSLAVSDDGGKTWQHIRDVETDAAEFSYPSLCQDSSGVIHLSYTWRRQAIRHVAFSEEWITE